MIRRVAARVQSDAHVERLAKRLDHLHASLYADATRALCAEKQIGASLFHLHGDRSRLREKTAAGCQRARRPGAGKSTTVVGGRSRWSCGNPDRLRSVLVGPSDVSSRRVSRSSRSTVANDSTCHRFRARARGQLPRRFEFSERAHRRRRADDGIFVRSHSRPPPRGRRASTRRGRRTGAWRSSLPAGVRPRATPRSLDRRERARHVRGGTVNRAKMAPPPRVSVRSSGDAGGPPPCARRARGHPRRPRMRLAGLARAQRLSAIASGSATRTPSATSGGAARRVKGKPKHAVGLRIRSRSITTNPARRFQTKTKNASNNAPWGSPESLPHDRSGCASVESCTPRPTIARCRSLNDALNARGARCATPGTSGPCPSAEPRRRGNRSTDGTPRSIWAPRATWASPRALEDARLRTDLERGLVSRPPTPTRRESAPARRRPDEEGTRPARKSSGLSDPSDHSTFAVDLPRTMTRSCPRRQRRTWTQFIESRARATRARKPVRLDLDRRARRRPATRESPHVRCLCENGCDADLSAPARGPPRRRSASRRHVGAIVPLMWLLPDAADAIPRERVPAATCASRCAVRHSAPGKAPAEEERKRARSARATVRFRLSTRSARTTASRLSRESSSWRRWSRRHFPLRGTEARGGASAETVAVSSSSSSSSSARRRRAREPRARVRSARTRRRLCVCSAEQKLAALRNLFNAPARWGPARAPSTARA